MELQLFIITALFMVSGTMTATKLGGNVDTKKDPEDTGYASNSRGSGTEDSQSSSEQPPQGRVELDNTIDTRAGSDTCAQLNHVQGVVIQLLASHYENLQGMQVLTGEAATTQRDLVALRARVEAVDSAQATIDERVKEIAQCQQNISATLAASTHGYSPSGSSEPQHGQSQRGTQSESSASHPKRLRHNSVLAAEDTILTLPSLDSQVSNLTKTIQLHDKVLSDYERKFRRMQRLIKNVEHKLETLIAARVNDSIERDINKEFMEKQKEINGNLVLRLRAMEESFRQMTQSDSPVHNGGCPTGFMRHIMSCYRLVNETSYWTDAENRCQWMHPRAHLAGLETPDEEAFLVHSRNYNNARWTSNYIWIGATDMGNKARWTWVGTGAPLSYTNWRPGQPSMHDSDWQHCVYLRTDLGADHQWDDWHCNAARLNYVCEINLEA